MTDKPKPTRAGSAAARPFAKVIAGVAPVAKAARKRTAADYSHLRQDVAHAPVESQEPNTSFADKVAAASRKARGEGAAELDPGSFAGKLSAARGKVGRR